MQKKGPHQEKRLSPAFVSSNPPPGKYGDGNGLMLVVEPSGSKRWVQRLVINGKRRDIGHGSLQLVSLKEAREKAFAARKLNQATAYDIDVHGFRSTFRTWAQDQTDYSREVVEAALSHQEQDAVVAAYARSDLFAKRRSLMEQWEAWCLG